MTFVNEWYQTGKINWRVPIATMLAAAIMDGVAHVDSKAATGLSVMVLLAAVTTRFNDKSVIDTVSSTLGSATTPATKKAPVRKAA
jgi:hypothetical protein